MWSNKSIDFLSPLKRRREKAYLAERALAQRAGLARMTLRNLESGKSSCSLKSLSQAAHSLGASTEVLLTFRDTLLDYSTAMVSCYVYYEGFESWKIHFMNLVDEFRRTWDTRLINHPPLSDLDQKLKALLASMVLQLADEAGIDPPPWARANFCLKRPWFIAGFESLKPLSLVESPVYYRKNNIFVLKNFLDRR